MKSSLCLQGFESAYHFFFICPNYALTRERYLEALFRNHTTHELVFCKDTSADKENEAPFLKVQDYILKSKIFAKKLFPSHSCACGGLKVHTTFSSYIPIML